MNSIKNIALALLTFLSIITPAEAQSQLGDSLTQNDINFHPRQLAIPSSLIILGAYGVSNGWFCSVKQQVRDDFKRLRGDCRFRADDQLQYLPVIANLSLGFAGAKPRHPIHETIAATATAYAAMGLMVNSIKFMVSEKRPDTQARNSFPSGHTATAFMGAELVRQEYGNCYGVPAYAFASAIAFLRLYNDRHWLNDVIAGAGFGILSARIGYSMLPVYRRWFRSKPARISLAVMPAYQPSIHALSIGLSCQFSIARHSR